MKYRIVHTTDYHYSQPVSVCHSEAHLQPRVFVGQDCLQSHLEIFPQPVDYQERLDFFGNHVVYFEIQQPHTQLTVTAISDVWVQTEKMILTPTASWESVVASMQQPLGEGIQFSEQDLQAKLFCLDSPMAFSTDDLRAYAQLSFKPGGCLLDVARDLTARIYADFSYDPTFTTVATPLATVLEYKRGVCQDFAHLAIACFRSYGLSARYVSGYIETLPPPGEEKLAGSDASHAWFGVYFPGVGWLDFDPTNNCQTSEQHVTLAWGRDYSDVTPLKGVVVGGSEHTVSVSVDMRRIE